MAESPTAIYKPVHREPPALPRTVVRETVLDKAQHHEITTLISTVRRVVRNPHCREQIISVLRGYAVDSGAVHVERVEIDANSDEGST